MRPDNNTRGTLDPVARSDTSQHFRSKPGVSRLLWHPAVHEYYDERCYYYLLSGNFGQGDSLLNDLESLFSRLSISSYTANIVYGPYDVMVRVWLTDAHRKRFLRALRSNPGNDQLRITGYLEFVADEISYDIEAWKHRQFSDQDVGRKARIIEAVVDAEGPGSWSLQSQQAERHLVSEGFATDYMSPSGEKVYMFFSDLGPHRSSLTEDVKQRFHDARLKLSEAEPGLISAFTVHSGVGFCRYLLKFVVRDYHSCLPVIQKFQETGSSARLQAWSLVVADYGERYEGETIDAILARYPNRLRPLVDGAPASQRAILDAQIQSLNERDADSLALILGKATDMLARAQEIERFTELLIACLTPDNRKGINQILSFLTSIEGDVRYVLPRLAAKHQSMDVLLASAQRLPPGEDLAHDDFNGAPDRSRNPRRKIDHATLLALLLILRDLADFNNDVSIEVGNALGGASWRSSIRNIVSLRNDYVHSRLADALNESNFHDSEEIFSDLMTSIQFQVGMEQLRENLTGQNFSNSLLLKED